MSSSEATPYLIDLVLDGEATPAETHELEMRAASSPDLARDLEASRRLFAQLARSANVQPPPQLREDVMTRIRGSAAPIPRAVSFASARARRRLWVSGALAAAAAVAAIILYPMAHTLVSEPSAALSGAMVSSQNRWKTVAQAGNPAEGVAVMRRNHELIEIRVSIPQDGAIALTWDRRTATLRGNPSAAGKTTVACPAGNCKATVFEASVPARLSVELPTGPVLTLTEPSPTP